MHIKNITAAGVNLSDAEKALIMVHGRGANAEDILQLASYLHVEGYALLAPEATNHTWYPHSFMVPAQENEPWLSSAIGILEDLVNTITAQGIDTERIYLLGFSQGACLTLEFAARNATKFGGIAAFTGGLIGDKIDRKRYHGDFMGTPIFIGTGNPDPHVPVERVRATTDILEEMNATVTEQVYDYRPHTISQDEIEQVNNLIFK